MGSLHKLDKTCIVCSNAFISNVYNAKTCSTPCQKIHKNKYAKVYGKNYCRVGKYEKTCKVCNKSFIFKHHSEVTCSPECKKINHLQVSYDLLDGDWDKYLQSLCRNRIEPNRQKQFTAQDLKNMLIKQEYKCALTGETLTCVVKRNIGSNKRNRYPTNVSIDRIDSQKGYTIDNIQLVCLIVNIAKQDSTVTEYINWCRKVADYALRKQT